jgi:hypothetical protein
MRNGGGDIHVEMIKVIKLENKEYSGALIKTAFDVTLNSLRSASSTAQRAAARSGCAATVARNTSIHSPHSVPKI